MIKILSIGEKLTEIIEGAFGVSLLEFLINLLATIVLILIVRFLFWNKVTAFLDKKKEKISEDYKEREDLKIEAEEALKEAKESLESSKEKAHEIITNAKVEGDTEKEKIISEARIEARSIIEKSKETALQEKEEILNEAKEEVVSIASLMASKMIEENIDQDKYNEKVLKDLGDE